MKRIDCPRRLFRDLSAEQPDELVRSIKLLGKLHSTLLCVIQELCQREFSVRSRRIPPARTLQRLK